MMVRKERINRGGKYWESELPIVAETDGLFLKYFREAGKFQIIQKWKDKDSGEIRRGKTLTLCQKDLSESDQGEQLLQRFLKDALGEE